MHSRYPIVAYCVHFLLISTVLMYGHVVVALVLVVSTSQATVQKALHVLVVESAMMTDALDR